MSKNKGIRVHGEWGFQRRRVPRRTSLKGSMRPLLAWLLLWGPFSRQQSLVANSALQAVPYTCSCVVACGCELRSVQLSCHLWGHQMHPCQTECLPRPDSLWGYKAAALKTVLMCSYRPLRQTCAVGPSLSEPCLSGFCGESTYNYTFLNAQGLDRCPQNREGCLETIKFHPVCSYRTLLTWMPPCPYDVGNYSFHVASFHCFFFFNTGPHVGGHHDLKFSM